MKRGARRMQAIFVTGGKQYKVSEGDVIYVELLKTESETVEFDNVLMTIDGDNVTVNNEPVFIYLKGSFPHSYHPF